MITDAAGQNFVAYAKDGFDWVHFTKVANAKLKTIPSSCLGSKGDPAADIEQNFLVDIWNGSVSNWAQLCADIAAYPKTPSAAQIKKFAADDAPICVYTSQTGSGTLATWDSYLGISTESLIGTLTPNTAAAKWAGSNGLSSRFVNGGCTNGTSSSKYGATHQIFENETEQLIAQGAHQAGAAQYSDTADSIFFYSFGRYTLQCVTGQFICQPKGFKVSLGEIGHQFPTRTNIIATALWDWCFTGIPWAAPRYVYNVYGNGDTSAGVPTATAATVNYISEIGFICKSQTQLEKKVVKGVTRLVAVGIVDPRTGLTYRSEIAAAITSNGFFPLPLQRAEDQGTINFPAVDLLLTFGHPLDAYSVFDPNYNTLASAAANSSANLKDKDPGGYCKVFTTSG